ncbi:PRKR-interacting protein 1-like [Tropilaelaps mercedesae]|uniref:PRKR-interacting protein 1-like n=1 Tax=Tropilaelaps mercedesae TaxID=418985 RepID=A0A1V9XBK6_9ACAR|nr:PRKR-interacting protein 1-like [Tropilaelaps mercedesae]
MTKPRLEFAMVDSDDLDLLGLPKPKVKKEREEREVVVVRTARDAQRVQLDRLMRNPDKEVHIPEKRQDNREHKVPDFVRNVMGSSAGAGSGEFHVYRQLRKKVITRVKLMEEQAEREKLDEDFAKRQAEKEKEAQLKAARKRAKRQKKKQKMKDNQKRAKRAKIEGAHNSDSSGSVSEKEDAESDEQADKTYSAMVESESKQTVGHENSEGQSVNDKEES